MTGITLAQIGWDILDFYRANVKNDDSVDIRQIYFWIQNMRAKLLKQKFDKPLAIINEAYAQALPTLALQTIDSTQVPSVPSNRYIVQTVLDLPQTLERANYTHTFTRISAPNLISEGYPIIRYEDISTYGNGVFNTRAVVAFILGQKICLMSKDKFAVRGLGNIYARGVFQNPLAAGQMSVPTFNEFSDYPITQQLIEELKQILLQNPTFQLTEKPPEDVEPVTQDELTKKV